MSLALLDGEILGLVGPNGSGKTTFLNAVSGIVPARGSLRVAGRGIGLGKPGRLRRLEVMRAFQAPQTYEDLTCLEDVLLSTSDRRLTGITPAWFARPWVLRHEHARWDNAVAALERVGLGELARGVHGPALLRSAPAARARAARWPRTRASCSSTSRPPG